MSKAHLTAIARKAPSKPVQRLKATGAIVGKTLDYGCGRGVDADWLGCDGYDPHYRPERPVGTFETIVCNYVLNVIVSESERLAVLRDIQALLDDDGFAYITVRNDRAALNGYTSKGTWQGLIVLDLPVRRKCADYVTYVLRKHDTVTTAPAVISGKALESV